MKGAWIRDLEESIIDEIDTFLLPAGHWGILRAKIEVPNPCIKLDIHRQRPREGNM